VNEASDEALDRTPPQMATYPSGKTQRWGNLVRSAGINIQ
jgi:hypothetical protein